MVLLEVIFSDSFLFKGLLFAFCSGFSSKSKFCCCKNAENATEDN